MKKYGSAISKIIEIEVPMLELISRLQEHETKTVPVIQKYNQLHGVIKIDGPGTFDEVFDRISVAKENGFKNLR